MKLVWLTLVLGVLFGGVATRLAAAGPYQPPQVIVPGQGKIANDYLGGFHGASVYRIKDGPVACYLTKHPEHPNTSISCVVIPKGK